MKTSAAAAKRLVRSRTARKATLTTLIFLAGLTALCTALWFAADIAVLHIPEMELKPRPIRSFIGTCILFVYGFLSFALFQVGADVWKKIYSKI